MCAPITDAVCGYGHSLLSSSPPLTQVKEMAVREWVRASGEIDHEMEAIYVMEGASRREMVAVLLF